MPVPEAGAGACGFLGLDPLYVANEGKAVVFVAARRRPGDGGDAGPRARREATRIGWSRRAPRGGGRPHRHRRDAGGRRAAGEQLPRIC